MGVGDASETFSFYQVVWQNKQKNDLLARGGVLRLETVCSHMAVFLLDRGREEREMDGILELVFWVQKRVVSPRLLRSGRRGALSGRTSCDDENMP